MKFILMLICIVSTAKADMSSVVLGAIRKRSDVILLEKNTQNWFWRNATEYGIDRSTFTPLAIIALPLASHHVSSKWFAEWRPTKGLTIHPDLDYCLTTDEKRYGLTIKVGW